MRVFLAVLGGAVVLAILWEVFNDLFHPAGEGALSQWIGRRLFALFRRWRRLLPMAGPLTVVVTIAAWVAGLVLGFALVYLAMLPRDFQPGSGPPPPGPRFVTALNFSLQSLISLAFGDVIPYAPFTRFLSSVEALLGFALLTASVSSIVLLYPALSRMRLLARGVSHLVAAQSAAGVVPAQTGSDTVLAELARDVTNTRIDLIHFPLVYFFATEDQDASLARWTGELARFAREGGAPGCPPHVRMAAHALDAAMDDLARVLAEFLHMTGGDRDAVFRAYAADHLVAA
jgi:hypothetical protein